MPKAILKNGAIQPTEPLPPDWREGQELVIEAAEQSPATMLQSDRWFDELDALCKDNRSEERRVGKECRL